MNAQARLLVLRQVGLLQPWCGAFNAHLFASQQVRDKTLAQLKVRQLITLGRVEQAGAKAQFTTGGNRSRHPQGRRDFPRHDIHPAQAAEQRYHRAAVFSDGQHRRLFAFLQQQRRQGADHNPGRAQGNDRRALLIQLAHGRAKFAVGLVGAFHPAGQAVDQGAGVHLLDAARGGEAALAENDDRRRHHPCHLSPGTIINEKYGEDMGST